MGTKPKTAKRKPSGTGPGPKPFSPRKPRKQRPNSILLADLSLWVTVVDECLYHPVGAFGRAAKTEGFGSVGNITQRLDVLEGKFGKLLYRDYNGLRSGVPTFRGVALAELFTVIGLLYSRASSLGNGGVLDELHKLKVTALRIAPQYARRVPDDLGNGRIKAGLTWRIRQKKTGRSHEHKKLADWPTLAPSPVRPRVRH